MNIFEISLDEMVILQIVIAWYSDNTWCMCTINKVW